ncbi:MAG: isocitrate/isopropylmalate family dehydrogenase, partial [Pseudomonadota bacterium]
MTDAPTVAVFAGDGIGVEVTDAAMQAVAALERRFNFKIDATHYDGGAAFYAKTGKELADGAMDAAGAADAILLGAMGLPDIRLPDGTEVSPHLKMRDRFGLFAGVRPVKKYPNTPTPLGDPRADNIDLIILRESTEGLFASAGKGTVEDDAVARDTLVITRATSEKLFDVAFDLARKRHAAG